MGGSNTGGSARDNGGPAMAARPSVQGGGARGLAEAGVGGWGGGVGGLRLRLRANAHLNVLVLAVGRSGRVEPVSQDPGRALAARRGARNHPGAAGTIDKKSPWFSIETKLKVLSY